MSGAAATGRALGVDLGARRIGIALTDPERVIASPHDVLIRAARRRDDHRAIVELARSEGATTIVVGLPRRLSGDIGTAAQAVLDEVEELRAEAAPDIEVVVYDERLTTVVADRAMRETGASSRQRRGAVDKVAAAVLLSDWLEAGRER
jgi:putative Holliday junction resolvase